MLKGIPVFGLVLAAGLAAGPLYGAETPERELFPFVIPWDDAASTVTDLSGLNHRPAGKFGPVTTGPDGHFHAGAERIRFLGVNIVAGACFPEHAAAEKLARRLAKLGVNLVRFHHMDSSWDENLFPASKNGTRELNPDTLERLDFFFARLKAQGIYADINLLCSRKFTAADGLPAAIDAVPWKEQQTPGMFDEAMIRLQREYAQKLLTHVNPYTGLPYAQDPAVAFVEITNEHGLLQAWTLGGMDRLPPVFLDELRTSWNGFLRRKYGTQAELKNRWTLNEPAGGEMLANGDFRGRREPWSLWAHAGAAAETACAAQGPKGLPALEIKIEQPGTRSWHIQICQSGLAIAAGRTYTVSFWARADQEADLAVNVMQAHAPWSNLGLDKRVRVTPEWKRFKFVISATGNDERARIGFENFMLRGNTYSLAGVSLTPGGRLEPPPGATLEQANFTVIPYHSREQYSQGAQEDWTTFLWERERDYWRGMYRYLKDDLRVNAPVFGTVVGTSTPNLQAEMNAVDSHAYWQHPQFDEDWGSPWRQVNSSMVGESDGGAIGQLGVKRVLGKPFLVTEYNHAFPNSFDSETLLFLAPYAAFQDWDAVLLFALSNGGSAWERNKIDGFFDTARHPGKLVSFFPAACMFRRGGVSSARETAAVPLDPARERALLPSARAWMLVDAGTAGLDKTAVLRRRVGLDLQSTAEFKPVAVGPDTALQSQTYVSDTGEILWDAKRKYLQVSAPACKSLVGYVLNREFDLDGIVIRPRKALQSWAALTLSLVEGKSLAEGGRKMLLTACGLVTNSNLVWKHYPDTPAGFPPPEGAALTVGYDWGDAPTLAEGIECDWVLPYPANRVKVYALDGAGARRTEVPVADERGRAVFRISRDYRTLWYEVNVDGK